MKKFKNILLIIACLSVVVSCDRDLESEGIATGTIRYPSIRIQGEELLILPKGVSYQDEGAQAFLGEDDITPELVTQSDVNTALPGIYTVDYQVSIINELDQPATVTRTRVVIVREANACDYDISGTYTRNPASAAGAINITANEDECGVFTINNFLFRTANISSVEAYIVSSTKVVVFEPTSPFGSRVFGQGTFTPTGLTIAYNLPEIATTLTRVYVKQ